MQPLTTLIEEQGQLDLPLVCAVADRVASDLDALHAEGLVSRDVKPATILLDEDGTATLSGQGVAKDAPSGAPPEAIGSLDYMSPEQLRSEELTPAVDVYALGCVIYACLCGAPPFADRQGMAVLWAHLQDQPAEPSNCRPDLPAAASLAVLGALEKDPGERTRSAGEFARQLRAGCN